MAICCCTAGKKCTADSSVSSPGGNNTGLVAEKRVGLLLPSFCQHDAVLSIQFLGIS